MRPEQFRFLIGKDQRQLLSAGEQRDLEEWTVWENASKLPGRSGEKKKIDWREKTERQGRKTASVRGGD